MSDRLSACQKLTVWRPRVKLSGFVRFACVAATCGALLLSSAGGRPWPVMGRALAAVGHLLKGRQVPGPVGEVHVVHIPYFTTEGGLLSILTLNNNMAREASANVTLFNSRGESLTLDPIDLRPMLPARFDIAELVRKPGFESGNVQVSFTGSALGIASQVTMVSASRGIAFESIEDEYSDFSSSRLDGVLWRPDSNTVARLALTNVTDWALTATVSVGRGENEDRATVDLGPHETEVVDATKFLESDQDESEGSARLAAITYNAGPGSVMVTGFDVNFERGFSCNLPFVDRMTLVSKQLAGAHVRVGTQGPPKGFRRKRDSLLP